MSLLDKLKGIFKITIAPNLKEISIKIGSDNKLVSQKANEVVINPSLASPVEKKKLSKLLEDFVKIEEGIVIEEKSSKMFDDFSKSDKKTDNRKLLEFFKGKIPPSDYEALRASLYLKDLHEARTNRDLIASVKKDIIDKYGERGGNIANLCTAGYFQSTIKPLYEEMYKEKSFSLDKFKARYDVIVTQTPIAVFVNRKHTSDSLKNEMVKKIEINRKYGIKRLNIHAIGESNISKVKEVLRGIEQEFSQDPDIESGSGYFMVTIWF